MSKQFSKLSQAEQEAVELEYHQMRPEEFDELMKEAQQHTPDVIRLPARLVAKLRKKAASAGEPEYQAMVRRWIEERLQQEHGAARGR